MPYLDLGLVRGPAGADGVDGATWHSGTTTPSAGIGSNNDFYFDTVTQNVYKKISGTWTLQCNIKGADGADGSNGSDGSDGKNLEFTWDGTRLGVRVEGETTYSYVDLKGEQGDTGDKGDKGDDGADGKSLEFTWDGTQLGVRVEGQSTYSYVDLKGDTGAPGSDGKSLEFTWSGTQLGVRVEGDASYTYVDLKGEPGEDGADGAPGANGEDGADGRGIVSITRTSGTGAPGTTDTYTITYSDNTTSTFQVYNGADGQGSGDMTKAVYDTDNDGKVDAAEVADSVEWDGVQNKPSSFTPSSHTHAQSDVTGLSTALSGKVDKVTGKGLSTEDYTTTEKNKLAGIEAGAQVNTVTSVAGKTGAVTLAKSDVGLGNVDNVKQMPIAGGTFTGIATAQSNTSYTTAQVRNIILSTSDPSGGNNGDIWIKYST